MATEKVQVVIRVDNVRCSFPELFKPSAMKPGDKPAYSIKVLMPHDHPDMAKVMKAVKQVGVKKWGKSFPKVWRELKRKDRVFLTDGNDKTDQDGNVMDGYEDMKVISARSYVKPTVIDRNKAKLSEDSGRIYSGCYVNVVVAIWAQSGEYGKRVNCQLQGVQYRDEGESFGGGKAADPDMFDDLADEFGDDGDDDFADEPLEDSDDEPGFDDDDDIAF